MVAKKVAIFDLDGTLIDSVPDLALAVGQMMTAFGLPTPDESLVRTWVGNGSQVLVERSLAWADASVDMAMAHERFLQAYADCTDRQTKAYAGVSDGLNALKERGWVLAMATNKPEQFLPQILARFGWQQTFAQVVGGDSLPKKKPDPMQLLYIAEQLGVDVSQCVMVGDSKNDVLAGLAAGMTTLALRYGYNYGEPIDDSQPTMVFDNFDDLVSYLLARYE